MENSLKEIAQIIANKMKDRSSFSNEIFNKYIKDYNNLTEYQINEVKKLAMLIFEKEYNIGFGR